jgi:flagellar motor protein MotB
MRKATLFLAALACICALGCGSKEVKQEPASLPGFDLKLANQQLARIPVDGFAYKSSEVPAQKWDKWAETAAPVVKGIIDRLPANHVLQVTGHTDASGPENPQGAKPGNIKISTDRAKAVHAALRKKGITSEKLTYKGVGSSEPLEGVDSRSPEQRRVTFVVVPKGK